MQIKTQSACYFDEFMGLKCAPDILKLKWFPNAKEITESFGAYAAVREHLPHLKLSDPSITCYVIGDGKYPRTGATFALRSKWQVVSVDPQAAIIGSNHPIQRLKVYKGFIQDFSFKETEPTVIVHVHSHAKIEQSLKAILAPERSIISIPCCVEQKISDKDPDIEYDDLGILSGKHQVKIWKNL